MPGVKGQKSGGHNKKTRAQLVKDGTFRKDRHGDLASAEAPPGVPDPPKVLDGEAHDEWHRMIARLTNTGALSIVDDGALFQYCRLFAETEGIWLVQEETAETIRILQENLDGQQCRRPEDERLSLADLLAVAQEITKLRRLEAGYISKVRQGRMALRTFLVEFGLTPAARGRVKLPEKPKDADSFTAFQNKRPGIVRVK